MLYGIDYLQDYSGILSDGIAIFYHKSSSISVEDLRMNCSHICLTNVNGQILDIQENVKKILLWAKRSNYTKIFYTDTDHNSRVRSVTALRWSGAKKIGRTYTSKRTKERITWYMGDINSMLKKLEEQGI
jgi:hypothetical protein